MPKSPGYSSITNSFPSTVLPAGFFTTPRRTFRVFWMKKAEGEYEKNISGIDTGTIFNRNISTNCQSFLFKKSPQKKSFIWNQYVCNFERKGAEEGTSVEQLNLEIEHPAYKSWSQTTTKNHYKQKPFCQKPKNTIRDGVSTALYTAYTVYTVRTACTVACRPIYIVREG